jgi:ribonuclease VapC
MFVDACAIIALLSDEPEADRVSDALVSAEHRMTSAVAVLEAALGLARPDKFGLSVEAVEPIILEFLDERGIEIRDLPPAMETTRLALSAADRFRAGRHGLNLGDCLHYACAKFYGVPILATDDAFRQTDLETVP